MANSLTSPDYHELSSTIKEEHSIPMLNPLSNDLSVMRQSMLFSGLTAIGYNVNRKRANLKFFEFGKTYHNFSGTRVEDKHLSIFVTGNRQNDSWAKATAKTDFYFLKTTVENITELKQSTSEDFCIVSPRKCGRTTLLNHINDELATLAGVVPIQISMKTFQSLEPADWESEVIAKLVLEFSTASECTLSGVDSFLSFFRETNKFVKERQNPSHKSSILLVDDVHLIQPVKPDSQCPTGRGDTWAVLSHLFRRPEPYHPRA